VLAVRPKSETRVVLRSQAHDGGSVEVVIHDGINAVISNVSQIEHEVPGQGMLDRQVPRFHVRVLEM